MTSDSPTGDSITLDNLGLGYMLLLANEFGFRPTRADWTEPLRYEKFAMPDNDWQLMFRSIGTVNGDEAVEFARALRKAAGWVADSHPYPERFKIHGPAGKEWLTGAWMAEALPKVADFAEDGAFRVSVETEIVPQGGLDLSQVVRIRLIRVC